MPDSGNKNDAIVQVKPEPIKTTVTNHDGTVREAFRDPEKGFLVKKPKAQDVVAYEWARNFLMNPTQDGKIRFIEVLTSMYSLATGWDDKTASAAVRAAEFLRKAAMFADVKETDDERETKMEQSKATGMHVTVILPTPETKYPQIEKAPENKPLTQPSWLTPVEIIQNPPKDPVDAKETETRD
jgi:hypothetical protein